MKCPACNVNLLKSERQRIEIDYCPEYRGVWLDRGELVKIVEKNSTEYREKSSYRESDYKERDRSYQDYNKSDHEYDKKPYRKKKESFLSEIFDFED